MPAAPIPPKDALQRLLDGLQMFIREHLALARAEMKADLRAMGRDVAIGALGTVDVGTGVRVLGADDMTFGIIAAGRSVKLIDSLNTVEYTNATAGAQVVRYISNHDVDNSDGTPLDLFGGKTGSMAAFVVFRCLELRPGALQRRLATP